MILYKQRTKRPGFLRGGDEEGNTTYMQRNGRITKPRTVGFPTAGIPASQFKTVQAPSMKAASALEPGEAMVDVGDRTPTPPDAMTLKGQQDFRRWESGPNRLGQFNPVIQARGKDILATTNDFLHARFMAPADRGREARNIQLSEAEKARNARLEQTRAQFVEPVTAQEGVETVKGQAGVNLATQQGKNATALAKTQGQQERLTKGVVSADVVQQGQNATDLATQQGKNATALAETQGQQERLTKGIPNADIKATAEQQRLTDEANRKAQADALAKAQLKAKAAMLVSDLEQQAEDTKGKMTWFPLSESDKTGLLKRIETAINAGYTEDQIRDQLKGKYRHGSAQKR